ncbi:DMT family transporter [Neptunicoccus cionae]|uniref:Membrane protein n=1 Tax=Neptunicoccus cionae TaxID=2035344 RepID=A0A916QUQ8_9RHOB|nr:DMT family transporter [Amylibacter cionae]GGA14522.1 membrane protein [Amylibacter cionae]
MIFAPQSDTLRAILMMILSMAAFAATDMFVKLASLTLPPSQVMFSMGIGGTILFGLLTKASGTPVLSRRILHPAILSRGVAEIIAACGFLMALTILPFSTASSILQVTPLLVTLGAALFLRETVSWRRWSAIFIGMSGVLIILNPFAETTEAHPALFSTGSLLAIIGVFGLAGRDLSTRFIPKDVPNLQASTWGFFTVAIAGVILSLFSTQWQMPNLLTWGYICGLVAFSGIGYFAITSAMRIGDISAVAPFRYSRIIFAFTLSVIVFDEVLTLQTLFGAAVIVAAGLYVWLRERRLARAIPPETVAA